MDCFLAWWWSLHVALRWSLDGAMYPDGAFGSACSKKEMVTPCTWVRHEGVILNGATWEQSASVDLNVALCILGDD